MRKLNPRGVRKIDVQRERKAAWRKANELYPDDWVARNAYHRGWEQGFKDTQKRALDRLDEAISVGRLEVK